MDDEMGEFEDGWEDEYESDEEVVDAEAGKPDDGACARNVIRLHPVNIAAQEWMSMMRFSPRSRNPKNNLQRRMYSYLECTVWKRTKY